MNHETDCIICMNSTEINTLCCKKKLCASCRDRVTDINPEKPLCPNCRRDLNIEEFIFKNDALNLYDLRIHDRFIPLIPLKKITTTSTDNNGNIEVLDEKIIPAIYDDNLVKFVSKDKKIQNALASNDNLLFARNKKKPSKNIFLTKIITYYYPTTKFSYKPVINLEYLKNIPLKYISSQFIKKFNNDILYYKDNTPLKPLSDLFITNWYKTNILKNVNLNKYINITRVLLIHKHTIMIAQQFQARCIGFKKKQDIEKKQKEDRKIERKKTTKIITGEFPSRKKIKLGDIHITPDGDKGICAGYNLWKYKSGKILVLKKGRWIVSDRVCKIDDLSERLKNILLKN